MSFNITDFNNKWANFKEELKSYFNSALDKNGDTMQGSLILASAPSQDLEAATKEYVDKYVKNYQHPWTVDMPLKPIGKAFTFSVESSTKTQEVKIGTGSFRAINSGKIYAVFSYSSDKYCTNGCEASLYINNHKVGYFSFNKGVSNSKSFLITLNKGDEIAIELKVVPGYNGSGYTARVQGALQMYANIETTYTYDEGFGEVIDLIGVEEV